MPPYSQQDQIVYPGDGLHELPRIPKFVKIMLAIIIIVGIVLVVALRAAVLSPEDQIHSEEEGILYKRRKNFKRDEESSDNANSPLLSAGELSAPTQRSMYRSASTGAFQSPGSTTVDFPVHSPIHPTTRWRAGTSASSPTGDAFQYPSPSTIEAGYGSGSKSSQRASDENNPLRWSSRSSSTTVESACDGSRLGRITNGIVERIGQGFVDWVKDGVGEEGLVLPVKEDERIHNLDI
jgi:hypothetical protein